MSADDDKILAETNALLVAEQAVVRQRDSERIDKMVASLGEVCNLLAEMEGPAQVPAIKLRQELGAKSSEIEWLRFAKPDSSGSQ